MSTVHIYNEKYFVVLIILYLFWWQKQFDRHHEPRLGLGSACLHPGKKKVPLFREQLAKIKLNIYLHIYFPPYGDIFHIWKYKDILRQKEPHGQNLFQMSSLYDFCWRDDREISCDVAGITPTPPPSSPTTMPWWPRAWPLQRIRPPSPPPGEKLKVYSFLRGFFSIGRTLIFRVGDFFSLL